MAKRLSICVLTKTNNFILRIAVGAALLNPSDLPCAHPTTPFAHSLLSLLGATWRGGALVCHRACCVLFQASGKFCVILDHSENECSLGLTQVTHLGLLLGRASSQTDGSSTGARLSGGFGFCPFVPCFHQYFQVCVF